MEMGEWWYYSSTSNPYAYYILEPIVRTVSERDIYTEALS